MCALVSPNHPFNSHLRLPPLPMTNEQRLLSILAREAVDYSPGSPLHGVQRELYPVLCKWAGEHLAAVRPSGSYAKGTANASGTDIDLFVSLHSTAEESLASIYSKLHRSLAHAGYQSRKQNVSIGVNLGGIKVDVVPARQHSVGSTDHSLCRQKQNTWTKTNIDTHVSLVANCGYRQAIRCLKLWRDQKGFELPSFLLEMVVIIAVNERPLRNLEGQISRALYYLRDRFASARIVDPANSNNVISDDLTQAEKLIVSRHAGHVIANGWDFFIR